MIGGQIKKTMVALALIASGVCANSALAAPETSVIVKANPQQQAKLNQLTEQRVKELVKGASAGTPSLLAKMALEKIQSDGENVYGTVLYTLGAPRSWAIWGVPNFEMAVDFNVTPQLAFENGKLSTSQVKLQAKLIGDSSDYYGDFEEGLRAFFEHFPMTGALVTQPNGELYAEVENLKPFKHEDDWSSVEVPSAKMVFSTYGNRSFGHAKFSLPLLKIDKDYGGNVTVKNLWYEGFGAPVKTGVTMTALDASMGIEHFSVVDDNDQFELNNGGMVVRAKADAKGLFHGDFTAQADGRYQIEDWDDTIQKHTYAVKMAGTQENMDYYAYQKLLEVLYSDDMSAEMFESPEFERAMLDFIRPGPRLNFSQMDVTLDGHVGKFTFDISMEPLAGNDERSNVMLLLMNKLRINATMDVPIEWINVFEPDEEDIKGEARRFADNSEGYITLEKNRFKSSISYIGGNLEINGKRFNYSELF